MIKNILIMLLCMLFSFAVGRHSGRADAECEMFTAGYESGYQEIISEMKGR